MIDFGFPPRSQGRAGLCAKYSQDTRSQHLLMNDIKFHLHLRYMWACSGILLQGKSSKERKEKKERMPRTLGSRPTRCHPRHPLLYSYADK